MEEEEKQVFIDPLCDFGFKKLFLNKAKTLKDFLNAVLKLQVPIAEIIFISTEQLGELKDDRKSVFDIHCRDEQGNYFIIEIQRLKEEFFRDRSVYYSTFPIRSQGEKGKWNYQLKKTYTICILDFSFDDTHPDRLFHEVKLVETGTLKVFSESLTLLYVELPKFKKLSHQLITREDKWMYVLTNMSELKEIPLSLADDPIFKEVFMDARKAHLTELELQAYYASKKAEWDEYAIKETAMKEGRLEGKLQGIVEGRIEGKLEGRIEGKIEGKLEGIAEGEENSKKKMATLMKLDNEPVEKIMKYTGLSAEEIEVLE